MFNEEEIDALYNMINLCNQIDATPILITTPFLSEYKNYASEKDPNLLRDFYGIISNVQQKTGVKYIDYSNDDRFTNKYNLFFNTDHLNRYGAKKFTKVLLEGTL